MSLPKRKPDSEGRYLCSKCKVYKFRWQYYKSPTQSAGIMSWCKDCVAGRAVARRTDQTEVELRFRTILQALGEAQVDIEEFVRLVEIDIRDGRYGGLTATVVGARQAGEWVPYEGEQVIKEAEAEAEARSDANGGTTQGSEGPPASE
jgi:hypothetical protein